jgi:hypothetical protein
MEPIDLKIGDLLAFHSEPKADFDKIVAFSIQRLTCSPYQHIAICLKDGATAKLDTNKSIIGAIASGFTPQTLRDAIDPSVDTVHVYRYHATTDGLTPEQQKGLVQWCMDRVGVPYDYLDIIALAIIMELKDTTWLSREFRTILAAYLKIADDAIIEFERAYKFLTDMIMGNAVNLDNGLLICSRAGYEAHTVGAGVPVRILNADARESFYKLNGDISQRFKSVNQKQLLLPNDPAFITPRDLTMSPDYFNLGVLKI